MEIRRTKSQKSILQAQIPYTVFNFEKKPLPEYKKNLNSLYCLQSISTPDDKLGKLLSKVQIIHHKRNYNNFYYKSSTP